MKSGRLIRFAKSFIIAGILLALVVILIKNVRELEKYDYHVNGFYLFGSFFLLIIATLNMHTNWYLITSALECNLNPIISIKFRIKSEIGKYIPGRILGYGYLIVNYQNEGKDPMRVLSSSLYELYLSTFSSFLFFTIIQIFVPFKLFEGYKLIFLIISIIGVLLLYPVFFQTFSDIFCRLIKKEKVKYRISFPKALCILSFYLLYWIIFSSAFLLFVKAFTDIRISDMFYLSGSFAISSFAGFMAFFIPAGLGAREGVLVLLLGVLIGNTVAVVISISSRIWIILCDILLFFAALTVGSSGRSNSTDEK